MNLEIRFKKGAKWLPWEDYKYPSKRVKAFFLESSDAVRDKTILQIQIPNEYDCEVRIKKNVFCSSCGQQIKD